MVTGVGICMSTDPLHCKVVVWLQMYVCVCVYISRGQL